MAAAPLRLTIPRSNSIDSSGSDSPRQIVRNAKIIKEINDAGNKKYSLQRELDLFREKHYRKLCIVGAANASHDIDVVQVLRFYTENTIDIVTNSELDTVLHTVLIARTLQVPKLRELLHEYAIDQLHFRCSIRTIVAVTEREEFSVLE